MPGRKPIPTALKALRGNPGKRALNDNEPKPTGIPECPAELSPAAKLEWDRISVELIALGLLTKVDRAALAAYCTTWATFIDADQRIQKDGLITETKNGTAVQHPALGVRNRALELMHKFLTEFGLTPSSRSRLQVQPAAPDGEDEFWLDMLETGNLGATEGHA